VSLEVFNSVRLGLLTRNLLGIDYNVYLCQGRTSKYKDKMNNPLIKDDEELRATLIWLKYNLIYDWKKLMDSMLDIACTRFFLQKKKKTVITFSPHELPTFAQSPHKLPTRPK